MNKSKYSQIYIMTLIESLKACNERLFDNDSFIPRQFTFRNLSVSHVIASMDYLVTSRGSSDFRVQGRVKFINMAVDRKVSDSQ